MQETFAFRKTLKKVAAVGTSLALVGVTISGALAAGLADLPAPFNNNPASTVVVYGGTGDMDAVTDVVTALGEMPGSGSTTVLGGTSVTPLALTDLKTGERKSLPVGNALNSSVGFKTKLTDTSSVGLWSGNFPISIGTDKDYNAHEAIDIGTATLTTSLEEGIPAYGDKPFLKVPIGSIGYRLELEKDLDTNNFFANATSTKSIRVPFLGKQLIINSASATSITALSGDKQSLRVGDTVQVNGKTVTLRAVSSTSAYFDVDGQALTVTKGQSARGGASNVELYVDDVFDSQQDVNDLAIVVLQGTNGQAINTYNSGENFVDEDQYTYLWEWNLASLNVGNKSLVTLGVKTHESLASTSTSPFGSKIMDLGLLKSNKGYLSQGDYLCLPYRYACLVLEGTDGDVTWNDYTLNGVDTKGLDRNADATEDTSNAGVISFRANGVGRNKGLETRSGLGAGADLLDTDYLYFWWNSSAGNVSGQGVEVYAADKDTGKAKLVDLNGDGVFNATDIITTGVSAVVGRFDNKDYNAGINISVTDGNPDVVTFRIKGLDPAGSTNYASDLVFTVNPANATDGFTYLGNRQGRDTTPLLNYTKTGGYDLSGATVDVMRKDGFVVVAPQSNFDSDKLTFKVPTTNLYKYWVRMAKPVAGSSTSVTTGSAAVASLKMMDTEVNLATLGKNVVAVGGPCVNAVTRSVLGLGATPVCGEATGMTMGSASLELKDLTGGKKALLVYGWEAEDTRRAAIVVKNAMNEPFKTQLAGKNSATVSGTGLTVAGITVTAV